MHLREEEACAMAGNKLDYPGGGGANGGYVRSGEEVMAAEEEWEAVPAEEGRQYGGAQGEWQRVVRYAERGSHSQLRCIPDHLNGIAMLSGPTIPADVPLAATHNP